MPLLKTIEWVDNKVRMVDQTQLPTALIYDEIEKVEEIYDAIKVLKIRGAPAIGIAAAFGLYLAIRDLPEEGSSEEFLAVLKKSSDYLASSRPTAVNLAWALERMKEKASSLCKDHSIKEVKKSLLEEAQLILEEDNEACRAIGEYGFEILKEYNTLLTHCNAGGLATGEFGTALAPVYIGQEKGKIFHVYADETRPLLQGARITALELKEAGIPVTLICDNMAASVMAQGRIDAVIVGTDRIAGNGDVANKIGTYSVAIAAREHNIPFYVASPISTIDLSLKSGKDIPIEQRDPEEVTFGFGRKTAPDGIEVYNPAFDVTPNELVTAVITERGVIYPPFAESPLLDR
jgi:methylthioribose-1-phosphate isomerase